MNSEGKVMSYQGRPNAFEIIANRCKQHQADPFLVFGTLFNVLAKEDVQSGVSDGMESPRARSFADWVIGYCNAYAEPKPIPETMFGAI